MKNTHSEVFYSDGSDLASRVSARNLRNNVEQAISNGKLAVVDLTEVISISESYADELFAVLVEQHGLEWFANNVKVLHQAPNSDNVLHSIATAIRRRLENQKNLNVKATLDNLIAAKKQANCHYQHG